MGESDGALAAENELDAGPAAWDLSCLDWKTRLAQGRSLVPDLPLDAKRAQRAINVFKMLRIPDVPGQPTFGEAAGAWILDIVGAMFGAFDAATRMRMVRGLFLLVPKKNAKTTYDASIVTGAVPATALFDEVHLLGHVPNAAASIAHGTGSMVSVPDP